jgi:hypothetical protein
MKKKYFLAIVLSLGFVGCAKQEDKLSTIPVMEGAYAIEKVSQKKEGYYQLHFKIARKYPNTEVMAFYENFLKNNSWEPVCQNPFQWREGVMANEDPSKSYPTNSLLQVMSKEKEMKNVIILVRHNGKELENGSFLWDKEKQYVVISLEEIKNRDDYENILSFSKELCAR